MTADNQSTALLLIESQIQALDGNDALRTESSLVSFADVGPESKALIRSLAI